MASLLYKIVSICSIALARPVLGDFQYSQCHLEDTIPLRITSSLVQNDDKTFAYVFNSTLTCMFIETCNKYLLFKIKGNTFYFNINDLCAVPNGTEFNCINDFPGLMNNTRKSTIITYTDDECSRKPTRLTPTTTANTTTVELTSTTEAPEDPTTSPTNITGPANTTHSIPTQIIENDCKCVSETWKSLGIAAIVLVLILVFVVVILAYRVYKLLQKVQGGESRIKSNDIGEKQTINNVCNKSNEIPKLQEAQSNEGKPVESPTIIRR